MHHHLVVHNSAKRKIFFDAQLRTTVHSNTKIGLLRIVAPMVIEVDRENLYEMAEDFSKVRY